MRILTDIIRVILTTEDDGFLLVTLDFTLSDELFFLCSDAFQKDRGRFVIRVLRDKLTTDCKIKDFRFGCFDYFLQRSLFLLDFCHKAKQFFHTLNNKFLLALWWQREQQIIKLTFVEDR